MNQDKPINLADVKRIHNLCNKIQKELDTKHHYSAKDQENLFKLLDRFKGKYKFLSKQEIVSMYPIPEIVKFRLRLN